MNVQPNMDYFNYIKYKKKYEDLKKYIVYRCTCGFQVGDRVKRVGKGLYPLPKYNGYYQPPVTDEGFGLTGVVTKVQDAKVWMGKRLPKMYFVKFPGKTYNVGIIPEHLELAGYNSLTSKFPQLIVLPQSNLVVQTPKYKIGDTVFIKTRPYAKGTVIGLWRGSKEERSSGRYGLDKYKVITKDGTYWFRGSSLKYYDEDIHDDIIKDYNEDDYDDDDDDDFDDDDDDDSDEMERRRRKKHAKRKEKKKSKKKKSKKKKD